MSRIAAGSLGVALAAALGVAAAAAPRAATPGITQHVMELPGRALAFSARVERRPVSGDDDRRIGDAGIIAFLRRDGTGEGRPVTFVLGGGPGSATAYLNLGALGPWRIEFAGSPSAPRPLLANADTWLDFTDLVFIDSPGTGFGRLLSDRAGARGRLWSVEGDIAALASVIARWLLDNDRMRSPKLVLGQSYGGLRAPLLAEALRRSHGVALNGLILLSPILDYGWRNHARTSPLSFASLLPSLAAARMELEGRFAPEALAEVEAYAAGPFVTDFLRGLSDAVAVERMVDQVTRFTGLPREVGRAARGRIDEHTFVREIARAQGRVASSYDGALTSPDPDPSAPRPDFADPFLSAARAPFTAAMLQLLRERLRSRQSYEVSSQAVFEGWNWGNDGGLPEAVSALRRVLALDPALRVMVVHGYTDLQTPYFESKLILDQLPDLGGARIERRTYAGGHMFYSRAASRAALRGDAEAFVRALAASDQPARAGAAAAPR